MRGPHITILNFRLIDQGPPAPAPEPSIPPEPVEGRRLAASNPQPVERQGARESLHSWHVFLFLFSVLVSFACWEFFGFLWSLVICSWLQGAKCFASIQRVGKEIRAANPRAASGATHQAHGCIRAPAWCWITLCLSLFRIRKDQLHDCGLYLPLLSRGFPASNPFVSWPLISSEEPSEPEFFMEPPDFSPETVPTPRTTTPRTPKVTCQGQARESFF